MDRTPEGRGEGFAISGSVTLEQAAQMHFDHAQRNSFEDLGRKATESGIKPELYKSSGSYQSGLITNCANYLMVEAYLKRLARIERMVGR